LLFHSWLNRKDANYISSVGILIYLGAVAQGAGYFGTKVLVNTGSLAIMNNAIPVGLIVNLVIWNKEADIKKILIGGSLIFLLLRLMNT
jgi:hypothetical protein